jgi:hypothetical protein
MEQWISSDQYRNRPDPPISQLLCLFKHKIVLQISYTEKDISVTIC